MCLYRCGKPGPVPGCPTEGREPEPVDEDARTTQKLPPRPARTTDAYAVDETGQLAERYTLGGVVFASTEAAAKARVALAKFPGLYDCGSASRVCNGPPAGCTGRCTNHYLEVSP